MFAVDKNELMDDWTHVCDQVGRPGFLSADCGGKFEAVYCTCCTFCCQDSDPECNDGLVYGNIDARWETDFTRTAYNFGPKNIYEDEPTNASVADRETDAHVEDEVHVVSGDEETGAPVNGEETDASDSGGEGRNVLRQ